MWVPKTHKGSYVLARIVSLPMRMVGTTFIVEDPTGRAEFFSITNLPLPNIETGPDFDAFFPLGQFLAIREPTYKPNQDGRGQLIRVDSPMDVHFLRSSDPILDGVRWLFPSSAKPLPMTFDHKAAGNAYFKQKKYLLAVKAYSDGLAAKPNEEQKVLLLLNRAQSNLLLSNFAAAYSDSSAVLSLFDQDVPPPPQAKVKATLRRARALEGSSPSRSAQGKELEAALPDGASDPAVGDFFGPLKVVELAKRGGGRGVVATRDIKIGEVVLVEKAFAVGRPKKDGSVALVSLNLHRNVNEKESGVALVAKVVARHLDDPSSAPLVYSLYGGQQYPPCFLASVGAFKEREVSRSPVVESIDIARIEGVFGLNESSEKRHASDSESGLFLSASLVNHSCNPSLAWATFGDVMVLRATKPITAGAEVFLANASPVGDKHTRAGILKAHFEGGSCNCSSCTADRAEGLSNLSRRRELIEKLLPKLQQAFSSLGQHNTPTEFDVEKKKMADLVDELESTYSSSHGAFRPDLVHPYHLLAETHFPKCRNFAREANSFSLKSLEAAGGVFNLTEDTIEILEAPQGGSERVVMLLNMAWRLAFFGEDEEQKEEAERWVKAAMELSRILDGDTLMRYAERYEKEIAKFSLQFVVGGAMLD
ncbi:hypothetical protein JCM8547_005882 [Rhodosporidiobolus lusitaniae]